MTLPTDSDERKNIPLYSGCFQYFPAALAGVARWSKLGNDKHNPGQPLHHSRGKSADHADCVLRHLMDIGKLERWARHEDKDHLVTSQQLMDEADALAWRALALSQELHERHDGAPLAPGAKLPEPVVTLHPSETAEPLVEWCTFKRKGWVCSQLKYHRGVHTLTVPHPVKPR